MASRLNEPTLEKLRKGEKCICSACGEGYYVATTEPINSALSFECNKCGCRLMYEPVLPESFRKILYGE